VIRFVNGQAESLFRCARDDLLGQPIEMLVRSLSGRSTRRTERATSHPGGRRPGLDGDEVIDQNRVVSPACLRGRQRTTPVPGERHLVPHWHRGRPRVIAAVRDMTNRRKSNQKRDRTSSPLTGTKETSRRLTVHWHRADRAYSSHRVGNVIHDLMNEAGLHPEPGKFLELFGHRQAKSEAHLPGQEDPLV